MKAIILAAGRGSCMEEATKDLPKCMMKLSKKTLIAHLMDSLRKAGFGASDIGIVTGYKQEKINIEGVHYFHNSEWERTNMFYSLMMADEWLRNDECIVCYSDIYTTQSTIEVLKKGAGDITITSYADFLQLWQLRFENPLDDLETFKVKGKSLVEIGRKPTSLSEIQGQFMGFLRFTPKGWGIVLEVIRKDMHKPVEKLDMTSLLQHLVAAGYEIEVLVTYDLWLECDNQNDIRVYEEYFCKAHTSK